MKDSIETNYPKDTEFSFYIEKEATFQDIYNRMSEKWGAFDFSKVAITSEYRHVNALSHDLYDASDYTEYLVITYNKT